MYVFTNLDDAALDALHSAVWEEKQKRVIARIESYPAPNLLEGTIVQAIKMYREQYACTLMEAKVIVEHYINKGKNNA